ncbi:hypothetical protein TREMEDRAFT_64075 [Tremella mesenterica DSM 1558]|nr:hypothetical protein TREMEDRAFT_64070 [Tremella mesenterica DSM 1558]EIW67488.1 hypothetical protein TREMEDRAFT_64073 [Tremella mesenterica DSM 1558]EIW67493.1 hypothetical protein TREMEDRAFT_64075 [Tremella mesenterica DSM 1558]
MQGCSQRPRNLGPVPTTLLNGPRRSDGKPQSWGLCKFRPLSSPTRQSRGHTELGRSSVSAARARLDVPGGLTVAQVSGGAAWVSEEPGWSTGGHPTGVPVAELQTGLCRCFRGRFGRPELLEPDRATLLTGPTRLPILGPDSTTLLNGPTRPDGRPRSCGPRSVPQPSAEIWPSPLQPPQFPSTGQVPKRPPLRPSSPTRAVPSPQLTARVPSPSPSPTTPQSPCPSPLLSPGLVQSPPPPQARSWTSATDPKIERGSREARSASTWGVARSATPPVPEQAPGTSPHTKRPHPSLHHLPPRPSSLPPAPRARAKTTAPRIPTWSPTVVLTERSDGMRYFQSPMAVDGGSPHPEHMPRAPVAEAPVQDKAKDAQVQKMHLPQFPKPVLCETTTTPSPQSVPQFPIPQRPTSPIPSPTPGSPQFPVTERTNRGTKA